MGTLALIYAVAPLNLMNAALLVLVFASVLASALLVQWPRSPAGRGAAFDALLALLIVLPVAFLALGAIMALAWFLGGATPEDTLPFVVAASVGLLASILLAYRRHRRPAADSVPASAVSAGAVLLAAAITLTFLFPVLFASIWMGSGAYPPVLFNVDAPYYLSHVHALARSQSYPPPSLNTVGFVLAYHYGVQLVSALLPRFGVLSAHTALFWVVVPVFLAGIGAAIWRLSLRAARSGAPLWLAVLALFFFIEFPAALLYDKIATELPSDPGKAFSRLVDVVLTLERFGSGYPSPSSLVGAFVVLAVGVAMADRTMPFRLSTIGIACGTLPLFKAAWIVPVGLWAGAWSLYVLVRERRIGPLMSAGAALLIALSLSAMSVRQGYRFSLSLSPFSHGAEWRADVLEHGFLTYGALWLAALLLILVLRSGRHGRDTASGGSGLAILLAGLPVLILPVFVMVTYVAADGRLVELSESKQWFVPLRWIPALALVAAMADYWPDSGKWRRSLVTAALVVLSLLPLTAKVNDAAVLVAEPFRWHDFADSAAIAPALGAIPVRGSLVAANDLSYPAENFARDQRQFQIAALYGHQAYGAALKYDTPENAEERMRAQEMLAGGEWTPATSDTACRAGWTHVLLSARRGFAVGVPGKLIYDAPDFKVYALPPCPHAVRSGSERVPDREGAPAPVREAKR